MQRGRLFEAELVVGDVAEKEAAGGRETLPALVFGDAEGFREKLPGLGRLALTGQHASKLEEKHLLAARVATFLSRQCLAQDPLRFGVTPRQLGELGAQGGDGEEAMRIVPREVEAALERRRELVQAPHAAGEWQEDPEQIDLELGPAGALAMCGKLLPQRGEQLLARDLGRCRSGGEERPCAGLGTAQQFVGGPVLVHRVRARREELAEPTTQLGGGLRAQGVGERHAQRQRRERQALPPRSFAFDEQAGLAKGRHPMAGRVLTPRARAAERSSVAGTGRSIWARRRSGNTGPSRIASASA